MTSALKNFFAVLLLAATAAGAGAQSFNLKAPIAGKPAFLTSAGQSADIEMVKVLLDRSKIPYLSDSQVSAAGLKSSGAKSLLVAIGGSSKGLGAAGISSDAELARVKAVIAQAKSMNMKIIGLHVGGEARRGELSDKFIEMVVPLCDYVIVVAEGNADGLFTKLCSKAKIPLDSVGKIIAVMAPLSKSFQ